MPLLLCWLTCACHEALEVGRQEPRQLASIQQDLNQLVAAADRDPKIEWVHGWGGNSAVKECQDGSVMGYCWQWQDLVYRRMSARVRALGWEASRININRDWFSEHHAVVVFDPQIISRNNLLSGPEYPAWVLDPWLDGKPEIYRLEDWLSIPVIVFEPAALEPKASPKKTARP